MQVSAIETLKKADCDISRTQYTLLDPRIYAAFFTMGKSENILYLFLTNE